MRKENGSCFFNRFRTGWTGFLLTTVCMVALVASALVPMSADAASAKKDSGKLEVGFITVGPVSDWGYNYQHNQGRLGMEAMLRDQVHTVVVENVPETADVERVMQRMIQSGVKLIFPTSYGYASSSLRVAKKNPGVTFMQPLGTQQSKNLGTCSLNVWEPAYVSGVVAAMTAKGETKFGFVGSIPIPPIKWTVSAFALGAQSVNPDITVDLVYTNAHNDPAAEKEAVNSLAARGVKAVYVLVDSPIAGVQAAEEAGMYALSHLSDLSSFAPTKWVTGAIWKWSKLYTDVTKLVLEGKWEPKNYSGGFAEGYVDIAPFGPAVPHEAQLKARALIAEIAAGKKNVFEGPIYDSEGKQRVPAGESMAMADIFKFDWVVKGVRGAPSGK